MMKGWQLRFFVLDEHTLCLNYYTSKEKVRKDIKRGKIFLKGAIIGKWLSPIKLLFEPCSFSQMKRYFNCCLTVY